MTAPHWFSANEYPSAAEMNTLSTAANEVYGLGTGHGAENWPAMYRLVTGQTWHFVRRHRYLFYASTGTLSDPSGVNDDVALSENIDGSTGMLDLDSLDWLLPGVEYKVAGVNACFEDKDPI